jgi:Immunoglobulin V-set domain.
MDTDKYYYNYTEYQDDPLEYKTTMRLQIKNLKPEDFGTYRCISQPGVQGQTTQEIQLFGK